jgi:hypothetical protein
MPDAQLATATEASNAAEIMTDTSRRFSNMALTHWYRDYVTEQQAAGKIPSRDEDWKAARLAFGNVIPRAAVREARRRYAPNAWKRQGRRKTGQETGQK